MTFSNVLVVICLLTVLNVKLIKTSNSIKCHRLCVCLGSNTLDCSNKNLTSVPNDLPGDTEILLLNNNQIESLLPLAFVHLPNLTKVDLSGNKINCGCSLTWTKYANFNIQLMAICQTPVWLKGRFWTNITMEDMCRTCKVNASTHSMLDIRPQKNEFQEKEIVLFSCSSGYLINGPTSLMCLANGSWNSTVVPFCQEISSTPVVVKTTVQNPVSTATTLQDTTTAATTSSTEHTAATSNEVPTSTVGSQTTPTTPQITTADPQTTRNTPQMTTVVPQTIRSTSQMTTVEPQTSTNRLATTYADRQTTSKDASSLPTRQPNVTLTSVPTIQENLTEPYNLTSLVEMSRRKELNPESLKNLIETLESIVNRRNYSDTQTPVARHVLLASSNLMEQNNRKIWSSVNKDFPAGEKLLNVINKAMRRHAILMLKGNNLSSILFNYSNIEAKINVIIAETVAEDFQFLYFKFPEGDYIRISGSSLKKEGKNRLAIIGMKSKQLGELLPRRSLIDDFDSFNTGSGLLSASIISLKENFSSPVRIKFRNKIFLGPDKENVKCAFWKHVNSRKSPNKKTSGSTKSGWSDQGCQVLSRNRSTTICHCDHMTDFVVLTQDYQVVPKATIIVFIAALCLLLGALIAFIRNIVVWCQTRRERLSVLIHECFAYILTAVVFLLGLFLDYHQAMCMIFAALLQWFVLAVFCWILAEFLQVYMCINFGWNRTRSRLKYFAILGWVVPFIVVAVTFAITRENDYGSKQWCWYSDSHVIFFTYVCPIALCILLSIIVILKIGCFKSDARDDSDKRDLSVVMALSMFLIPLVLCTFATAALSADRPEEKVFQYLFAVFCILLAIYIMVYHCWLDREIMKLSVRQNAERARPKRDYYSTKETVMYSEDTSEGKSFSLIFPSRKSPTKKAMKSDKKSAKRSDSASPFDYDSTAPMYPSINDSSLRSFKSQVSTQQHTLDTPPNTLSAITISRPNSQCIELTSLSDLDRRPDGAEQTDAGEPSEFYGSRHSNPMDRERQRTSGCSTDCNNATTFGKEKVVQKPPDVPNNDSEGKNRISGASSAGLSRTSRSSVSGASLTAAAEENVDYDGFEDQPFIRHESDLGPEIRSDPPAKIPKRRKRGSRRRLDDEFHDDDNNETKVKTRQSSSTLPSTENPSVELKQYTSF